MRRRLQQMRKRTPQLLIRLIRNLLQLPVMSRLMRMGLLQNQSVWWQMVARLGDVAHGLCIKRNKREEDMNSPVYSFSGEVPWALKHGRKSLSTWDRDSVSMPLEVKCPSFIVSSLFSCSLFTLSLQFFLFFFSCSVDPPAL